MGSGLLSLSSFALIGPSCPNARSVSPARSTPGNSRSRPGSGFGFGSRVRARDFRSGSQIGAPDRIRDSFVGPRSAKVSPRVARLRGTRDQAGGPGRKDPHNVQTDFSARTTPVNSAHSVRVRVRVWIASQGERFSFRFADRGPGSNQRFLRWAPIGESQPAGGPSAGALAIRLAVLDEKIRTTYKLIFPHEPRQSTQPISVRVRVRVLDRESGARDFRSGSQIGAPDRIRDSFVGPRSAKVSPRVARLRGTRDQAGGPGRKDPS